MYLYKYIYRDIRNLRSQIHNLSLTNNHLSIKHPSVMHIPHMPNEQGELTGVWFQTLI